MNTPTATAQSEMNTSAITINPGSTEPLGAISSSGSNVVSSANPSTATYSSNPSNVAVSPPEVNTTSDTTTEHTDQGEITKETTVVTTVEKKVETTVPDLPTPEPTTPAGETVTLEMLTDFISKSSASDITPSGLSELLLKNFFITKKPVQLLPGKLPGLFALITESLLDGVDGDPCELAIRRGWNKVLNAFRDNGLNVNTRPELEALGIDYTALLRDLPQGFETSQSS